MAPEKYQEYLKSLSSEDKQLLERRKSFKNMDIVKNFFTRLGEQNKYLVKLVDTTGGGTQYFFRKSSNPVYCEYDLIFIPPEIMQRASQDEVTAMHMVKLASRKFHKLKSINPEERQQLKAKASAQKAVAFYMDKFGGDDDGIEVISESSMTSSTWPVENRLSSEAQIVRDQRDRASLEQELEEQKREMERMRRREADRQAHEAQKQAEDKKQFQSQQFDQFSAGEPS
jgi:hypothetical protein